MNHLNHLGTRSQDVYLGKSKNDHIRSYTMTTATMKDLVISRTGKSMIFAFSPETLDKIEGRVNLCLNNGLDSASGRGVLSMAMHLMQENDEVVGTGFLAKQRNITKYVKLFGNLGYFAGDQLGQHNNIRVTGKGEIISDGVYEITWDGFKLAASHVPYIPATKGEGDYADKSRKVNRLFMGSQVLYAAFKNDFAVKLYWSASEDAKDYDGFASYIMEMFSEFAQGNHEVVAEMFARGMNKSKVWNATGKALRVKAGGAEIKAVPLLIWSPIAQDEAEVLEASDALIGVTYVYMRGNARMGEITFSEKYPAEMFGLASTGNRVMLKVE